MRWILYFSYCRPTYHWFSLYLHHHKPPWPPLSWWSSLEAWPPHFKPLMTPSLFFVFYILSFYAFIISLMFLSLSLPAKVSGPKHKGPRYLTMLILYWPQWWYLNRYCKRSLILLTSNLAWQSMDLLLTISYLLSEPHLDTDLLNWILLLYCDC